jgi:UDP:flavonoid glycosyltransferase YjiC (YdhE family)
MVVLIAPLDWGLGHATRCIPLIRALERAGHTVIPCAGGAGLRLLRAEFPHLTIEETPGQAMRYTRSRALLPLWLCAQLPLFLLGMWRDGCAAARFARKHGAGLVISDGRYGFRAAGISAVFITHQLEIFPPGPPWMRGLIARPLRALNRRALRGFAAVWVPDFPGAANLSGTLGHPRVPPPRVEYIRPLCRFRAEDMPWNRPPAQIAAPGADILALVSGPEPQRSLFEKKLRESLKDLPGTRVLVRGVPGGIPGEPVIRPGELNVFDHLPGDRLQNFLLEAENVVCRSGYTTVMELAGLAKRNVLLVPTPGQPEQEYLAVHARECGFARWQDQDALDVEGGLRAALALPGFSVLHTFLSGEETGGFNLAGWIQTHHLLNR